VTSSTLYETIRPFRPALWPFFWFQFLLGGTISQGPELLSVSFEKAVGFVAAGGVWSVCLGGTAAALVGVFEREPEAASPLRAGWVAVILLLAGLALSPVFSWNYFDAYLLGIVGVVLYGVPPIRLARSIPTAAALEGIGAAITLHAGRVTAGGRWPTERAWTLLLLGAFFAVLALRGLLSGAGGKLTGALYLLCVVNAFTCLALAEGMRGRRWGLALLAPVFLLWWVEGLRIYASPAAAMHKRRRTRAALLALLTQVAVAAGHVLG